MSDVSFLFLLLFEITEDFIVKNLAPPDGLILAEHLDLTVEGAHEVA